LAIQLMCLSTGVFFFKPLMKENTPAPNTCNDEGLCRMLYFSDD